MHKTSRINRRRRRAAKRSHTLLQVQPGAPQTTAHPEGAAGANNGRETRATVLDDKWRCAKWSQHTPKGLHAT
eukprot:7369657-Alexandrium_andersonii.AAC.1